MTKIIFFILLMTLSRQTIADDVVINITGRMVQLPCTIDTTQLKMELGSIYSSSLSKPGASGNWVTGTIKLSNCPTVTGGVMASFSGQQGTSYYKNTGTAKNVDVQLQTVSGLDLSNGKKMTMIITPQRTAELIVKARAYSVSGKVTEGTIQSTINVTYTYQ